MKVYEYYNDYATVFPSYYLVAADHIFDCKCIDCITFLVVTGLELMHKDDEEWASLREETVQKGMEQVNRIHAVASRLL